MIITKKYLLKNPNHIFVFGDNTIRRGKGGAAKFRDMLNTYGFITKKYPNMRDSSFYRPSEYLPIFQNELNKLKDTIEKNPDRIFLISRIGGGLANRYRIFEEIIRPGIEVLRRNNNVEFLYIC